MKTIKKIQRMDDVGLMFNLHPVILCILILLIFYILYLALWPKPKTFNRWIPAEKVFLSVGKCRNMKNVESPAIGSRFLAPHQRTGCSGAVEIQNGMAIPQRWLCENKPKQVLLPVMRPTSTSNGKDVHVGDMDERSDGGWLWKDDDQAKSIDAGGQGWELHPDPNNPGQTKFFTIKETIEANTPWYKDCCKWDEDVFGNGGGGVCVPKINGDTVHS